MRQGGKFLLIGQPLYQLRLSSYDYSESPRKKYIFDLETIRTPKRYIKTEC